MKSKIIKSIFYFECASNAKNFGFYIFFDILNYDNPKKIIFDDKKQKFQMWALMEQKPVASATVASLY